MLKETKIGKYASVKIDMTGLKNLLKGIEEKRIVRVGVLGNKTARSDKSSGPSNADIGLAHEKGVKAKNLPRRSWLQNPLEDHLPEYFKKLGTKTLALILVQQGITAYQELGLICEQIILKGFETGGYGKWKPLKPATIARKGSNTILVDTAQLKKSITSAVVTL